MFLCPPVNENSDREVEKLAISAYSVYMDSENCQNDREIDDNNKYLDCSDFPLTELNTTLLSEPNKQTLRR